MSFRIRPALVDDAGAIAELHVRSWQAAYVGLLPAEGLSTLSIPERTLRWQGWLAEGAATPTLVAAERGRILGFCSSGPSRDEDADPWTGEVRAIYVHPETWRRGVGRALWAAGTGALAGAGARVATLWVLEGNARAAAFYERQGARADGGVKAVTLLGAARRELRYRAPLATEPFVRGLMLALDQRDPSLRRYLDSHISFSGPACQGPDAVQDALLGRTAAPPGALDEQLRESKLRHLGAERWRLDITERLRAGGHAATWRHALVLHVPDGRPVTRVQALDLPGEQARLAAFMRRAGAFA